MNKVIRQTCILHKLCKDTNIQWVHKSLYICHMAYLSELKAYAGITLKLWFNNGNMRLRHNPH